tara:strand:+ start:112 stop:405 length:294 start_codon:yes stop_codon:yes gene_type:complete
MNWTTFFALFLLISITGCTNHYNDTIAWMDNLESGMNIEAVRESEPDFVEIDWQNPQTVGNEKWYVVNKIKGNNDALRMTHYLVFVENEYQYRESKK